MGFFLPDKLIKLASKFYSRDVPFYNKVSSKKVWCGATPHQIGIFSERDKRAYFFKREGDILSNEYLGILISYLL